MPKQPLCPDRWRWHNLGPPLVMDPQVTAPFLGRSGAVGMDLERPGRLRVEMLGLVQAWVGRREVLLGSPLQRAVFVVLASRAGRTVSRGELIDAVWGAHAPPSAENGVQTYVKGLRRSR